MVERVYKIEKLTVKNRCEIPVGGAVEVEVAEEVHIHSDLGKQCYGQFYLRKCLAKKGLQQKVFSPFPANWKAHGRAAGPIRNAQMASVSHALIAFWDGKSRETKNMIDTATKRGLQVAVVRY